jgi:hypothetical protein
VASKRPRPASSRCSRASCKRGSIIHTIAHSRARAEGGEYRGSAWHASQPRCWRRLTRREASFPCACRRHILAAKRCCSPQGHQARSPPPAAAQEPICAHGVQCNARNRLVKLPVTHARVAAAAARRAVCATTRPSHTPHRLVRPPSRRGHGASGCTSVPAAGSSAIGTGRAQPPPWPTVCQLASDQSSSAAIATPPALCFRGLCPWAHAMPLQTQVAAWPP